MDTTKAMIPSHTIEAMCRAYADAQRDVAEAFRHAGSGSERGVRVPDAE
jgi:hypothetical protein